MPSEPARNLVNGLLLAVCLAGLVVTLSPLAHPAALFAVATTLLVKRTGSPLWG